MLDRPQQVPLRPPRLFQPLGRPRLQHEPVARLALLGLPARLRHEPLHQQACQCVTELEPPGRCVWELEDRPEEPVPEKSLQALDQLPALPEEREPL